MAAVENGNTFDVFFVQIQLYCGLRASKDLLRDGKHDAKNKQGLFVLHFSVIQRGRSASSLSATLFRSSFCGISLQTARTMFFVYAEADGWSLWLIPTSVLSISILCWMF